MKTIYNNEMSVYYLKTLLNKWRPSTVSYPLKMCKIPCECFISCLAISLPNWS